MNIHYLTIQPTEKFILTLTLMLSITLAFAVQANAAKKTDDDISIGFVYTSPVGNEGWSYSHDIVRQKLDAMPGVSTSFAETVIVGPEAERVIEDMARKGTDIIFATSFGYMDSMLKMAKQFPDSTFMHTSGFKTAENMSNYMGRMYQARYLSGIVAGTMSKNNKIGYVAAFPIPEVMRGINAFTLGAHSVNPKVKVYVIWTNSWYNPLLEKQLAKTLIADGCDILAQHQDTSSVQEMAEDAGIYSIGYHTDMSNVAPNAHLTSAIWNWEPIYSNMLKKIRDTTWKHGSYWYGIESGVVGLAPFNKAVPEATRKRVQQAQQQLIDGSLKIFAGPIKGQNGHLRVPKGTTLTDDELNNMLWFVDGVINKN